MVGDNRNPRLLGNRPCREQPCHKRKLDHIAVFHSTYNQPQGHHQPHYIGFHTTTSEAAVSIAHSEFQPSTGVYFARSIDGTIGKARTGGSAYIIAKIRMGKVYEAHRNLLNKKHPLFNPQVYDFVHR
ncbi:unnamed protein product [Rotaria sp. Silwood2]|nr:unnamed protein product [Rotaria sp. Silwood2]